MSAHRFAVGDDVAVSEILPLPRQGRVAKQRDMTGRVDELRTATDGRAGYVIAVADFDGPFACRWYGVAFDEHCEALTAR